MSRQYRQVIHTSERRCRVLGADGKTYWKIIPATYTDRPIAPPGMSLEHARDHGLDFWSPDVGWIREGIKVEREQDS